MIVVWKYPIELTDDIIKLSLPQASQILDVDVQYNSINMWVKHESDNIKENRYFKWFGTGQPIDMTNLEFVKTLILHDGQLVFHLFEVV